MFINLEMCVSEMTSVHMIPALHHAVIVAKNNIWRTEY